MSAAELVQVIEAAGGYFTVDTSDPETVYVRGEFGDAPESLLPLIEAAKTEIANLLLRRWFMENWKPPKGVPLQ